MKRTLLFLYVICASIFCVNAQEKSLKYFDKTIPSILEITKQNTPQRRKVKSMAVKTNTVENLLGLNEHTTAVLIDTLTDIKKGFHESYVEYYKGVEVEDTRCTIHYDNTGQAVLVTGNFRTIDGLSVVPFLKETEALEFAKCYASKKRIGNLFNSSVLSKKGKNPISGQLLVYMVGDAPHLAYKFPMTEVQLYVYVDAMNGDVLGECAMNHHVVAVVNTVYSGNVQIETQYYSGKYRLRDFSRGNGIETYMQSGSDFTSLDNSWSSLSTNERGALDVYWGLEKVFDAYSNYFGRNSYDNKGAKIKAYANWYEGGKPYDNAYWNPNNKSFTFGYANENLSRPYGCLDVVAHEFTHAVTSSTSKLKYEAESGALNEGMSDVFATYIEKKVKPSKGYEIWKIGEDTKNYRDLRYPTCKYYKGSGWRNTSATSSDNGGVHTNSGVFSYWFYLISEGRSGSTTPYFRYNVNALGIEKAIQLCYLMNTSYLSANSTYAYAKECSYRAARQLNYTAQEIEQIRNAWYIVGVETSSPYLNGAKWINDTESYTISYLPDDCQIVWSVNNSAFSLTSMGNTCKVKYTQTQSGVKGVLSAVVKKNGTTIKTLTKEICGYKGFFVSYTNGIDNKPIELNYVYPLYIRPNHQSRIESPNFVRATITYSGSANPSSWSFDSTNGVVYFGMPSSGATVVLKVTCADGTKYDVPILTKNDTRPYYPPEPDLSNLSITGVTTFNTSTTYSVKNLPSGYTATWSVNNSNISLSQSSNQCTATYVGSNNGQAKATLTAVIKKDGTTKKTITKQIRGYMGFFISYTNGSSSQPVELTYVYPLFIRSGYQSCIESPNFVGATITQSGTTSPSYWNADTTNGVVYFGMPSGGGQFIMKVNCSNGDKYEIPVLSTSGSSYARTRVETDSEEIEVSLVQNEIEESEMTLGLEQIEFEPVGKTWTIDVFNVQTGKKEVSKKTTESSCSISKENLKPGLYVVRTNVDGNVTTEKVLIK